MPAYDVALCAFLGLDIGGANIKAATADGRSWHEPFALWKDPVGLMPVLREIRTRFPDADRFAVTMTGELCDCFETKRDGVNAILDATLQAADGREVAVWGTDGQWHDVEVARSHPRTVAAANWHLLATAVAPMIDGPGGLLVDTGSTTTDVIPIEHGYPAAHGLTDFDRLKHRELVYTGSTRTPVCAIPRERMAAEFFATMHDVNLVLGLMAEDASDTDTADHRPATVEYAFARLARMIGGDRETIPDDDIIALAIDLHRRQVGLIADAIRHLRDRPTDAWRTIIVSGSGEFLARKAVEMAIPDFPPDRIISLTEQWGDRLSACAPAYAAALVRTRHLA
jgi:(4-(4-[2-(gamma-L-glutamylamino)ethyl]phenoxymethyl)furan-2-yl)methanamine synthase